MDIQTYHNLYIIFMVLAVFFFILACVLFVLFDIKKIISVKSGRAMKLSIKELEQINLDEDNKRRKKYKGHSLQLSSKRLDMMVPNTQPHITEKVDEEEKKPVEPRVVAPIAKEEVPTSEENMNRVQAPSKPSAETTIIGTSRNEAPVVEEPKVEEAQPVVEPPKPEKMSNRTSVLSRPTYEQKEKPKNSDTYFEVYETEISMVANPMIVNE